MREFDDEPAYIYVVEDGDQVKIGSAWDVQWRWKTGIKRGEVVYVSPPTLRGRRVERVAHKILKIQGKCVRDEWFAISSDDAVAVVQQAVLIVAGDEDLPMGVSAEKTDATLSTTINRETRIKLHEYVQADTANRSNPTVVSLALEMFFAGQGKDQAHC
jgi:hypothetical protein